MKLQDLNEECLVNIFSSKLLSLKELCSLAETCSPFKRLTQRLFAEEQFAMKIGYYERDYKFTSKNYSEICESVEDVERILKNCGPYLSYLTIYRNDAVVNDLVAKYCGSGALKRLEIFTLKCTADLKVKFKPIYQQLMVLTIRECSVYKGVTVQQFNCGSLVELNIANVIDCRSILENTFSKLERLTFEQLGRDGRYFTHNRFNCDGRETLLAFVGRHSTLKTLVLNMSFEFRMQSLMHSIAECKELEEVTLRNFYSPEVALDFSQLKGFTKLRMLNVDIGDGSYLHLISLLKVCKGLEILKISTGGVFLNRDGGFLTALLQLENLRKLHLTNCHFSRTNRSKLNQLWSRRYTNDFPDPHYSMHILSIISRLTFLNELQIDGKSEIFKLSETDLIGIAKLVDGRPNVLTLKCKFSLSENLLETCKKNRKVQIIKLN